MRFYIPKYAIYTSTFLKQIKFVKKIYFNIVVAMRSLILGCKKIKSFKDLKHTTKKTYTYKSIDELKLKLDYYKPQQSIANDLTVIYVHGGGFSKGKEIVTK